jgi:transposase
VFVRMEATDFEGYLRRGLSLEQIAALTGRHPSTVAYWVKKHGLCPSIWTATPEQEHRPVLAS